MLLPFTQVIQTCASLAFSLTHLCSLLYPKQVFRPLYTLPGLPPSHSPSPAESICLSHYHYVPRETTDTQHPRYTVSHPLHTPRCPSTPSLYTPSHRPSSSALTTPQSTRLPAAPHPFLPPGARPPAAPPSPRAVSASDGRHNASLGPTCASVGLGHSGRPTADFAMFRYCSSPHRRKVPLQTSRQLLRPRTLLTHSVTHTIMRESPSGDHQL